MFVMCTPMPTCLLQSFTKEYSAQLRYTSLMRRSERLDDAMDYWSLQKYLGMPALMKEVCMWCIQSDCARACIAHAWHMHGTSTT